MVWYWERLPFTGLGAGARPTWGRGARLVRWALDVGLDSSVPSHQGEGTKKVHTEDAKKVVLQGLDNYIVSEKGGRLLVCKRSEEQRIKEFSAD